MSGDRRTGDSELNPKSIAAGWLWVLFCPTVTLSMRTVLPHSLARRCHVACLLAQVETRWGIRLANSREEDGELTMLRKRELVAAFIQSRRFHDATVLLLVTYFHLL